MALLCIFTVSCKKEEVVNDITAKTITSFYVTDILFNATIDEAQKTIFFQVPNNANLTSLTPRIRIPEGASISPVSNEAVDFTNVVEYTPIWVLQIANK